jgi:hypothetical protein
MEENKINFALTGLRLVIISLGVLLVGLKRNARRHEDL